jgi:mevalonate kinase
VAVKNKKSKFKPFRSKLLLFGEHIINTGAKGLAIPTDQFTGTFDFITEEWNEEAVASNRAVQELAEYIIHDAELEPLYDTNQLLTDLEHGLYFRSNIPQGYGLGSSGALVAALCTHYRLKPINKKDLTAVKLELAKLESFFHGKSSGLDPLVSFLDKAVLLDKGEVKEAFDLTTTEKNFFTVFLINTHKPRKTAPYVKLFLSKCKDEKFKAMLDESLVKANDICIKSFLKPGYSNFWKSLKLISQIHYDHLPEFTPDPYKQIWRQGLVNNEFYLKICGAGGGGFILGFCKKDIGIRNILSGYEIIEVMQF